MFTYKEAFGRSTRTLLVGVLFFVASLAGGASTAGAKGSAGAVYTLTNAVSGNAVSVWERTSDGALAAVGSFVTGGAGTGTGLGSQGAVILSKHNRWLFAVSAGSNEISVFAVKRTGLDLVDRIESNGERPISLTTDKDLLYVLNAGGDGNIAGFEIAWNGRLTPIADSIRPLSTAAADPAQIEFTPDGRALVVTEKATNMISTYTVDRDGRAAAPVPYPSSGMTPFGFAFGKHGHLIVSEAFGGAPDGSAVSSYSVGHDGSVTLVSGSVGTTETAACWVVVTKNGRYAYASNAGSGSISGYRVANDGELSLLNADGRTGVTAGNPSDMALTSNSRYLYALSSGAGMISAFEVQADGSLVPLAGASELPAGMVGLAAR